MPTDQHLPNVCMVGAGEYTTGFVGGGSSPSDKKIGVVALTFFDLRRRRLCGPNLSIVSTDGSKHPSIKDHFAKNIEAVYRDMSTTYTPYPSPNVRDAEAYKTAIDALSPGDAVTVFTPDSTHFEIAKYAMERGCHVMITKPAVKRLEDHLTLARLAKEKGVLCYVEHHKRFDPAYADARERARNELGQPSYFYSYMSQPKGQLKTFAKWAGVDSDISYYLNSHHIDVFEWFVQGRAVPTRVTASASYGIAESLGCRPGTEDTITLVVDWKSTEGGEAAKHKATAVFTASWTAPEGAGVHSEQGFHYVGSKGEARVNQSRRGYDVVVDPTSTTPSSARSLNPFYVQYAPLDGYFQASVGYGTRSIEAFARACTAINSGERKREEFEEVLPTIEGTIMTTAILEAGRRSLDEGRGVGIVVGEEGVVRLV